MNPTKPSHFPRPITYHIASAATEAEVLFYKGGPDTPKVARPKVYFAKRVADPRLVETLMASNVPFMAIEVISNPKLPNPGS